MNSKVEQPKAASAGDIVKYALAILLAVAPECAGDGL